jgi:Tripeptidyl peptidase II
VHAPLRRTIVNVSAPLKTLSIPLRPASAQLAALDTPRDTLPSGRIMHRVLLTYKLALKEEGDVTFVAEPLKAAVYDGALEGQLFAVFDANKKRLAFGDVYPAAVTLPKGARLCF